MTPNEIRERFLRFFEERGHTRVASASLVPENDPSLLFTGAGMNQFKDEFLGKGRRGLTRATTSQKCLRTGDLDNVGRTSGHHSFFEMLGNFSFGDYFKREAIHWAWEFLTGQLGLDPARLSVSVYEEDDEAYAIWRDEVGVPSERIFRFGAKDNFWPANAPQDGPNGPCGPCSEIFFDYGADRARLPADRSNPSSDSGRYIEVWNLVFTQFDRRDGGALEPLPQRNIDTGAGFERLVAVVEGVYATMDSTLFRPLLTAIAAVTGRESYFREGEDGVRCRRIADHARAACFLVGDGVRPGNEGRGYVLRRLIRRAIRDGSGLGIERPFLGELVPHVAQAMGQAYPQLSEGVDLLTSVLHAEEEQFRKTFRTGLRRLENALGELEESGGREMPADLVFQLHDTYGFPVDVTAEILAERGVAFSREEYERLMEEQRTRSRGAAKMSDEIFERGPLGRLAESGVAPTEFLGYGDPASGERAARDGTGAAATLLGIVAADESQVLDRLEPGTEAILVLDRSPFYAESGGQVGDTGEIRFPGGTFAVASCRAQEGYHLHAGRFTGTSSVGTGAACESVVDTERRDAIRRNHTATHLLHRALKDLLGPSVQQAGSLVAPDRLRFDFTFERGLTSDEVDALEDVVNAEIVRNEPLTTRMLPVEEAKRSGAVALFGERYPDPVRVVAVGEFSRELCGGTHCRAAGDIGSFRITTESSIAAGIRRIEAVTGLGSVRLMREDRGLLGQVSRTLGVPAREVAARVEKLLKDLKDARKKASTAGPGLDPFAGESVVTGGVKVHLHVVERPRDDLVAAANQVVKQPGDPVAAVLVSTEGGKVAAVVAGNGAAVDAGFDAAAFLRATGGRGGGRAAMAQGTYPGTPSTAGLREAVEAASGG